MNNREVGSKAEEKAKAYLEKQGVRIVAENFRNRTGEIDLIGYDGVYLVFFEVKYRKDARKGYPYEAVTYAKQKKICEVSDYYQLCRKLPSDTAVRYDVISIMEEEITWLKNAFPYRGRRW